jgi:hypothetical protein
MDDMVLSIKSSFKVFWDGSISLFKEAVLASSNNKNLVQALLNVRSETNNDEEPPVTLIHGHETEALLRSSIMRIKLE